MADSIQVIVGTNSDTPIQYKNLIELTNDIAVLESRINELSNIPVQELNTSTGLLEFGNCYIITVPVTTGTFTLQSPIDDSSVSQCIIYLYANADFEFNISVDDEKTIFEDTNLNIVIGAWNKIIITSAGDYYSIINETYKIN